MVNRTFFQWQDEYSVGIQEIDMQHKEIIILVRDLLNLCEADNDKNYQTFNLMLLSALEYVKNHFWTEEKLMLERNYPKYDDHKQRHEKMLADLRKMAEKMMYKEVVIFLREWVVEHLCNVDKEMGEFFIKTNNAKHENVI